MLCRRRRIGCRKRGEGWYGMVLGGSLWFVWVVGCWLGQGRGVALGCRIGGGRWREWVGWGWWRVWLLGLVLVLALWWMFSWDARCGGEISGEAWFFVGFVFRG